MNVFLLVSVGCIHFTLRADRSITHDHTHVCANSSSVPANELTAVQAHRLTPIDKTNIHTPVVVQLGAQTPLLPACLANHWLPFAARSQHGLLHCSAAPTHSASPVHRHRSQTSTSRCQIAWIGVKIQCVYTGICAL